MKKELQQTMATFKMRKIEYILVIAFFIFSCNNISLKNSIPENMQPDWTGISLDNIPVKFGQILQFNKDSIQLTAIVLDFDEDEGGKWIGLCFIDNNRLFGRQIPSGLINTTCLDLLDFSYLHIDGLKNFNVIQTENVNKEKIGVGAISPVLNLAELDRDFKRGIAQREKEQTPCDQGLADLYPVRECYFEIEKIIKQP